MTGRTTRKLSCGTVHSGPWTYALALVVDTRTGEVVGLDLVTDGPGFAALAGSTHNRIPVTESDGGDR